jgi:hypothetical protein
MGVQAVTQLLPPFRPGERATAAGAAFDAPGAAHFHARIGDAVDARDASPVDEREARGSSRRFAGEERPARTNYGRRAYDRRDTGFQTLLHPRPEHVRHSTPFVAQLLDQAEATLTQHGREWDERAAAYDASNARAESAYGFIETIDI